MYVVSAILKLIVAIVIGISIGIAGDWIAKILANFLGWSKERYKGIAFYFIYGLFSAGLVILSQYNDVFTFGALFLASIWIFTTIYEDKLRESPTTFNYMWIATYYTLIALTLTISLFMGYLTTTVLLFIS